LCRADRSGTDAAVQTVDVVVVGAGPVGLMLAGELATRGIDHVVLESAPAPVRRCKALGVTPLTLDVFAQLGVIEDALARGIFLRGMAMLTDGAVTGWLASDLDGDDSVRPRLAARSEGDVTRVRFEGLPWNFFAMAQYETEAILHARLGRVGGRVRVGETLVGYEQTADGVVARVRDASGSERALAARFLVGCDGAHSTVRKGVGVDFEGDAFPMTYMLGDVALDWSLPRGFAYRCIETTDGQLTNLVVAVPIPGDPRRYRLSMAAPEAYWAPDADLHTLPTLAQLRASAARALPPGTGIDDLRWASFYRISHRIVPRYRVGPVFLAGDAAHIHPPIGGQGMNTGIQDAFNLGWKLALAVDGVAAPALLESYHAERHPVGYAVVSRTSARMDDAIENRLDAHQELLDDSQMTIAYGDARWLGEDVLPAGALADGPAPGERLRDAGGLVRPDGAAAVRLKAVLGGNLEHALLLYADAATDEAAQRRLAELADVARERAHGRLRVYGIVAAGAQPLQHERFPWLIDREGQFARAYGARRGCLYLIRPDGYVGYRATPIDAAGLARHLDAIFAPR